MALNRAIARQAGIATGTALKTLIQLLAATNVAVRLMEVGIGFHGTTNTNEPVLVQLNRQSTAGTMTSLTPLKLGSRSETLQTTAQHTATAEPTAGNIVTDWTIHPQTGLVYQQPKGDEIEIPGAGRLGLAVTAANNVNADAYMKFEE